MKKKEDNAAKNEALKTVLTRDMLHGACCACGRDASKCVMNDKFKCQGFVADERRIAEMLNEKS